MKRINRKEEKELEEMEMEKGIQIKEIKMKEMMYDIPKEIKEQIGNELEKLGIKQINYLQKIVMKEIIEGKNIIIESQPQKGVTYLTLMKILLMAKSFPEIKEEDLEDDTKGGPYIIIICGDKNEAVATQYLIRNCLDINVSCWQGSVGTQKETKVALRKDPIVITTLSSLLNQLVNNPSFTCPNVQFVATFSMDKYDINDISQNFIKIFNRLPKCQYLLHSHTTINERISSSCIENGIKYIFEDDKQLQQEVGYCFYQMKERTNLIATIVTQFKKKKVVMLFASPAEAIFYEDILSRLEVHECLLLHSMMSIDEQLSIVKKFQEMSEGILLTTQERILPNVDLAVHVDIPHVLFDVTFKNAKQLIVFVQKHEEIFVEELKKRRPTREYQFPSSRLVQLQGKVEKLVAKQYYVHLEAREGYRFFIQSYHRLNPTYFSLKKLNLIEVAHSFGLENPTKVNLDIQGPENVSETPYEYKRKIFIGKDAYIPEVGKRNKIMKRLHSKK